MDAETLKLLVNAGSFGLVVFGWVWFFARAMPDWAARLTAAQDKYEASLARIEASHKDEHARLFEYWDQQIQRLHDRHDRDRTDRTTAGGRG